jgi:hypothetical protein
MKTILIQFTIICGEFEFDSHSFISVDSKATAAKIKYAVNKFLKSYWEDGEYDKFLECYMYCGGQLATKRVQWSIITEAQMKVLRQVGLNKGH